MSARVVEVFGIEFLDGDFSDAAARLDQGGVMVVPSGPGLATIDRDADYYQALKDSDLALFDSGLLVLLLRVFKRIRVRKLSGLLFLREFLQALRTRDGVSLFLVDPSPTDSDINQVFLDSQGITVSDRDRYVAPMYGNEVVDEELLRQLELRRPDYVLINIGGGVQEKLAHFLQRELSFRPGILCTGAAIAFLTGRQAGIPSIADRLSLGWLVRCAGSPRQFIPRYWAALRLIPVFFRYADQPPAS